MEGDADGGGRRARGYSSRENLRGLGVKSTVWEGGNLGLLKDRLMCLLRDKVRPVVSSDGVCGYRW